MDDILVSTQTAFFTKEPIDIKMAKEIVDDLNLTEEINFSEEKIQYFNPGSESQIFLYAVSEDGLYSIRIAPRKIDFFISTDTANSKFADKKSDLVEKTLSIEDELKERSVSIKWFGFVTTFFWEIDPGAEKVSKLLSENFLNVFVDSPHNTQIKYSVNETIHSVPSFNGVTISVGEGKPSKAEKKMRGLLIERDFNTRPAEEEDIEYTPELIKGFMEECENNFKLTEIKNML